MRRLTGEEIFGRKSSAQCRIEANAFSACPRGIKLCILSKALDVSRAELDELDAADLNELISAYRSEIRGGVNIPV